MKRFNSTFTTRRVAESSLWMSSCAELPKSNCFPSLDQGRGVFLQCFSKIIILKAFLSRLRRYQYLFSCFLEITTTNNNKDKCLLFPISSSCGRHVSNNGLCVNIRKMFLIAFLFGFMFRCLTTLFCSLFLFPETIPSGACYMLMRLDDERLTPGWEAESKCSCRDFKTIWAILFPFLFAPFAYKQTRRTNGVVFRSLFWK